MIPQRNLSLLSNRLAAGGGRRIPEAVLERDYCLAWFLAGLSRSDLKSVLVFKGGTALKRCYFGDYRFSEDLDFTLTDVLSFDELQHRLEGVYRSVRENSGIVFAFDRQDRQKHANSYTFYLRYTGPLPTASDVKVDITLRECLVFPIQEKPVIRGYEEYADIPEDRPIRVYSLEEIATEKILALADQARNEPRDLYDFWHLMMLETLDLEGLASAVGLKLEFRSKSATDLEASIAKKEARLMALWANRLMHQMSDLPPFDEVFRVTRRHLRQIRLP